jgi:hypothetical protein
MNLLGSLSFEEVFMFSKFKVEVKEIFYSFSAWNKEKKMFPIVGLLARHILGVLVSQIKVDTIIFMLKF